MPPINIAVADDHCLVRECLVTTVESTGNYKVNIQASNGQELIDYLKLTSQLPAICIVDISMPVLDGRETLRQIKANWPLLKVLMVSMFMTEFNIIEMLALRANGVFSKERGADDLIKALDEIYKEGFYSSEFISPEIIRAAKRKSLVRSLVICSREMEFLKYCVSEMTYSQIADKMGVGKRTIDAYRESLFAKLRIKCRGGLILFAIRSGLVVID